MRAQVLQQRPSGVFTYQMGTVGVREVVGSRLVVQAAGCSQTLTDPASPRRSSNASPQTGLTPEIYEWSLTGNSLSLTDDHGRLDCAQVR